MVFFRDFKRTSSTVQYCFLCLAATQNMLQPRVVVDFIQCSSELTFKSDLNPQPVRVFLNFNIARHTRSSRIPSRYSAYKEPKDRNKFIVNRKKKNFGGRARRPDNHLLPPCRPSRRFTNRKIYMQVSSRPSYS